MLGVLFRVCTSRALYGLLKGCFRSFQQIVSLTVDAHVLDPSAGSPIC